ncbi:MAG: hypothetical protein ABIK09_16250 [Pseudomonadota bacterium]
MRRPDPRTVGVFAVLAVLYIYPLFYFPINNPNERVRIYMTAAMVDHGSFIIGWRESHHRSFKDVGPVYERWGYVNDKALVCDDPELEPPDCPGPLYSAKAPGTSFLAVPAYAAYSVIGDTDDYREVTLFLRLALMVFPGLLFLWGFRRYTSRWVEDPWLLDVGTLGLGLGSMFTTYSHMVAGHQLTALLLFAGFALAEIGSRPETVRRRHLLVILGGMATAMSVVVEYPSVVGAAAVGMMILVRALRTRRWTLLLAFCAGCVPPAFLMGWFHTAAFGAPWRTAYTTLENPQFVKDIAYGFMGIRAPELENLRGSFLAPYNGMFFFAPWFALIVPAVLALPWLFRRLRGPTVLGAASTATAVVLLFTLFITCHSLWRGGWTLGPRYIVGFVPFAAFLILLWLETLDGLGRGPARFLLAGLVLVSIAVTGASSLVTQGFPTAFYNPLREATLPLIGGGYATRTLGHAVGLSGAWAWAPVGVALLWITWHIGAGIMDRGPRLLRPFAVLGALGLAGVVFWVLMLPTEQPTLERVGALSWLEDHYEDDGGTPVAQEELRDLRAMIRAFPGDGLLAGLGATEETRAGQWVQARRLARRWTEERWKRQRGQSQVAVVLSAFAVLPGERGLMPLWAPDDLVASLWAVSERPRSRPPLADRRKVPAEPREADPTEGGVAEGGGELLRTDPLQILYREARKLRMRSQLRDLEFPPPPSRVVRTGGLTGVATEEGPRASHGLPDPLRERTRVLHGPVGETSSGIEDPRPAEGGGGAGGLAPLTIPAVPEGPRRMEPDEIPVDGEPSEEDPGAVGRMDEAAVAADPAEAGVDRDGLLHDRGAVHEDPAPQPDPSPDRQPDAVEPTP